MGATYDPSLATDLDWVRFLVGDRDTSNAVLDDGEINALLVEERNKYLAAAAAGEAIMAAISRGLTSKSLEDMSVSFGGEGSGYSDHIRKLREKGAGLLLSDRRAFRIISPRRPE